MDNIERRDPAAGPQSAPPGATGNNAGRLLVALPFDQLQDELAAALFALKRDDPLAPVTVLAGSNLVSLATQRALALRGVKQINVRWLTFRDLAERVLQLAGAPPDRRRLPGLVASVLAGQALERLPATAALHRQHASRGAAVALKQAFDRLRNGGFDPTSPVRSGDPKADGVLDALQAYSGLSAGWIDTAGLFRAATTLAGRVAEPLIVYGVYDVNRLQRELLVAWGDSAPVLWLFPWAAGRHAAADARRERLLAAGFDLLPASSATPQPAGGLLGLVRRRWPEPPLEVPQLAAGDASVRILSASDDLAQTQEATRMITEFVARSGAPWHRVAVTARNDAILGLMAEALQHAGVPYFARGILAMRQQPAGVAAAAALELIRGERSRRSLFEFLHRCVVDADTVYWSELARRAGIAGGDATVWRAHFAAYRTELVTRRPRRPGQADAIDRELMQLAAAEGEVERLFEALSALPPQAAPSAFVGHLRGLLERTRPSADRDALLGALDALADLDAVQATLPAGRFVELAAEVLDSVFVSSRQFQDGSVVLASIDELRGLEFDLVVVLGLTERGFPAVSRADPYLDDEAVVAINQRAGTDVEREADRRQLDPLLFLQAAWSARRELILAFPRSDDVDDRSRLPSHFVLRVAELAAGTSLGLDDLKHSPLVISTDAQRRAPGPALTFEEFDAAALEAARRRNDRPPEWLALVDPGFGPAQAQYDDRIRRGGFGEHDGSLGPGVSLSGHFLERGVSATTIEDFAVCPYRVFAGRVLGLSQLQEPEETEEISPLDAGSLLHAILEDLFKAWMDHGLEEGFLLEHLEPIAAARFARAEAEGVTGLEGIWQRSRAVMLRDLRRYLERELASGLGTDWRPIAVEAEFGGPAGTGWQAVALGAGLPFRGKIDRVDVRFDGSALRVVDYKTGKSRSSPNKGVLDQGRRFQLPVYLQAALHNEQLDAGVAEYHYLTRRGGYRIDPFSTADLEREAPVIETTVGSFLALTGAGVLPPRPTENNCRWCSFKRMCGSNLQRRTEGKWQADERVQVWRLHHTTEIRDDPAAERVNAEDEL